MSHLAKVDAKIGDLSILERAAAELGLKLYDPSEAPSATEEAHALTGLHLVTIDITDWTGKTWTILRAAHEISVEDFGEDRLLLRLRLFDHWENVSSTFVRHVHRINKIHVTPFGN